MNLYPDDADGADRAFIDAWLAGTDGDNIVTGFVAGLSWIDGEGVHRWKAWHISHGASAEVVGLAALVAARVLTDCTDTDNDD